MEEEMEYLNRLQQIDEILHHKLMDKSDHSTASTNNTDIYVLETNESHYGDMENSSAYLDQHNNVDASFTVLNAPPPLHSSAMETAMVFRRKNKLQDRLSSDEIDESTEVLMIIKSDEKIQHLKSGISGTDSDVEVLMSEEIVESDWSAGEDLIKTKTSKNDNNIKTDDSIQIKSFESNIEDISGSIKYQSSTDQDLSSVDEFSGGSLLGAYEKLTKKDLVNIIREQATRIETLEAQLSRYRAIQQTFFDYVSELKHQLDDVNQDQKEK